MFAFSAADLIPKGMRNIDSSPVLSIVCTDAVDVVNMRPPSCLH